MSLLVVVHIMMCLALIGVILIQAGKSEFGIGFGSGSSSQSIFGSKGAGNFLTKATAIAATIYLVTSFVLTKARLDEYEGSVIGTETEQSDTIETQPAEQPKETK